MTRGYAHAADSRARVTMYACDLAERLTTDGTGVASLSHYSLRRVRSVIRAIGPGCSL
jgi:hypothetical protein